jgi:acyl-CoA synthetase (AMP-forming)/AMP-acid ligase II/thioester reductase-like protein
MSAWDGFITRRLRRRAEAEGDAVALGFLEDGETIGATASAGALDARVDDVAAVIADRVAAGERVLLLFPPGLDFVVGFLACLRADRVAVPAIPPDPHKPARSLARLVHLVDDARPAAVLSNAAVGAFRDAVEEHVPALRMLPWIDVGEVPRAARAIADPRADGLAFLQYTSGSTGNPKGVRILRSNLTHNLQVIHGVAPFRPRASVSWLPPFHDMGLIEGLLLPIDGGWPAWLMPPWAFLERPIRWLRAIERFGATRSGGPNFAFDLAVRKVDEAARATLDLACWRQAYCGAEPIRASSLAAFAEAFAPSRFSPSAWFPCYGLAEHTVLASCRTSTPFAVERLDAAALARGGARLASGEGRATEVVCVGEIPEVVTLRIVDPATRRALPDGWVGEIWLRSGSVADGYWGDAEASAQAFGATLAGEEGEGAFLRTGDLGYRRAERLFIVGRQKDLIIVRGQNHHPHDLERTAEAAHPSIRRGAVAAVATEEGKPAVVCEVNGDGHAEVIAAIRRAVSFEHGVFVDVAIVDRGMVPKTSSGKLARGAAAALVPARVAPRPGPGEGSVEDEARRAIAEIAGLSIAEIDLDAAPSHLPLDSLQTADAAAALEAIAGRTLPLEVWGRATSIRALLDGDPGAPPWLADLERPLPRVAPRRRGSLVLVTGGTGFVGQAIVRALQRQGRRVLALARGARGPEGLAGDVSLPRFGLDEARYEALVDELDVVVHAAGAVSWVLPYGALAKVNVGGTAEVIATCALAGARLIHVSSQIVCHDGLAAEGSVIDDGDTALALASRLPGLPIGYASSKAVAEISVERARAAGLDATIVRPSLVLASDGVRPDDVIAILLRACVEAGAAPDLDLPFSICPRDHLAAVIATIVEHGPRLVHVGDESRTLREVVAWLSLSGYDLPLVPWATWLARVSARGLSTRAPLRGLWPFFEAGTLLRYERRRRARVAVGDAHRPAEPIDPVFLDELVAGFRAAAWLPPPTRRGARATRASRALPEAPARVVVDERSHAVVRAEVGPALAGGGILGRLSAGFCDRPVGVYPARLTLDDGRELAVVLKAQATGAELRALCAGVARASDVSLAEAIERHAALLDVGSADRRERAIYRCADPALSALRPACYAVPEEGSRAPLVLEHLGDGAQVEKLDQVEAAWPVPAILRAVKGLAHLHAAHRGRVEALGDLPWARDPRVPASTLSPLWQALFEHARTRIDPRVTALATPALADLRWAEALALVPSTLLHNDVNPRNLALRPAGFPEPIVLYDWELSTPGPGVRDLAELLCFTLDPSTAAEEVLPLVRAHASVATPELPFDAVCAAFGAALQWLFFDRLTTYTVVSPVFELPWLDRVLATWRTLTAALGPRLGW